MKYFAVQKGNLIDRYVMDVGRRLPEKQRADVQMELRSALQDALDERSLDADNPQDEQKVVELLKEFGKPAHVAEGYGARTHLIGPELQPIYWMVFRISVLVISIVHLVLLTISVFRGAEIGLVTLPLLGALVGNYINSLLISFAVITIIFAVLEHFLPTLREMAGPEAAPKAWDPRTLPEITPDRDVVDRIELIVEVVLSAAFITVISFLPGWQFTGDLAIVGELIAAVAPFIPWMIALSIVQIGMDVYLLTQGRWQLATRWVAFAHAAGEAVLSAVILKTLQAAPITSVELVDTIARGVIIVVLIIQMFEVALKLYKALRPGMPLPWETWRIEEDIEEIGERAEQFGNAMEEKFKRRENK